jgi:hypothetical protein
MGALFMAKSGLPSLRILTSIGVGALSCAAGATSTSANAATFDRPSALLLHQGDDVFLSEAGGAFTRLDLGDTSEMRELLAVLRQISPENSAVRVPLDHSIVAGGGASVHKPRPSKKAVQTAKG